MDEIKLKYFASVARHLSFTKAAEDLHVVQSTISKQISALEKELCVTLFYRDHQLVRLTAAGARLAADVDDYMEQYRIINESVRRLSFEFDKKLRIGTGPFEYLLLSHPLKLFAQRWPNVEVICSMYTYQRLVRHLRSDTLDITIGTTACADDVSGSASLFVRRERWVVTAASDSPFWSLPHEKRSVLEGQTVITLFENQFEPVRPHCIKNDFRQTGFTHCNMLPPLLSMVRAGCGIALLPESLREAIPFDVRMDFELLRVPLYQDVVISFNPALYNTAVNHFIDCCREAFALPGASS